MIEDTVSYKNLVPGQKYRVEGKLMDKATGQPLMIKGKEVTVHDTFRAKEANGTTVVKFKFDGRELKEMNLVVFERLFDAESNIQIAIHEDINDEGQTVKLEQPKPGVPKTGDSTDLMLIGGIMLLTAAAATALVIRNKRRKNGEDGE